MGKKLNDAFLAAYSELDSMCASRFSVEREGVTEYINRLGALRRAYSQKLVLSHLIKYRRIKCDLDSGAHLTDKIWRSDISWIQGFMKDVERARDPISKSEHQSRRKSGKVSYKKLSIIFSGVALLALGVAVIILISVLSGN